MTAVSWHVVMSLDGFIAAPGDDMRWIFELAGYDFAAYCPGEATRWGGGEVTPSQASVPVVLSGVGVIPGQYIFAESSGAVMIPPGDLLLALQQDQHGVGRLCARLVRRRIDLQHDGEHAAPASHP